MRRLLLVNDELRVRLRFKDATAHYLVRYEDDVGLRLVSLAPDDEGSLGTDLIEEFPVLTESDVGTTWHCNALTTWATEGDKVLWSTDVPMEGQPKSIKIVGDVLLITTTAGHSFYARKDTGEVAFYDKSVLEGGDPVMEVLTLGRANMVKQDKRRSLARFIYAAVVLDDRRAIPFLFDCIDEGDGLPVKSMAIAALEKFNGHPEIWAPPNREPGDVFFQWIDMKRTFPEANRKAEIAKWREVFADELKADQ